MQILKGKKDRMHEVNQFVPQTSYSVISLDKKVEMSKALKRSGLSDPSNPSKTCRQEYDECIDEYIKNFVYRWPPSLARPKYHEATTLDDEKYYWNTQWLCITRKDFYKWQEFVLYLERGILEYLKWDGISNPHSLIQDFLDNLSQNNSED